MSGQLPQQACALVSTCRIQQILSRDPDASYDHRPQLTQDLLLQNVEREHQQQSVYINSVQIWKENGKYYSFQDIRPKCLN